MPRFKINDVFEITGRGCVLLGEILEGEISVGQFMHLDSDKSIEILSIESVRSKNSNAEIALMLGLIDATAKAKLKKLIGKIVSIS
jgi:selenocysteine-specific translation elongation factor